MLKDGTRAFGTAFVLVAIVLLWMHIALPRAIPPFLRFGVFQHTQTLLLVGTDINFAAGTHEILSSPGRSDTIMLLQIRPTRDRLNILSIPRDSFVKIPGYGTHKINTAFALGGIPLLKKTVENLTGIHIDRYLVLRPGSVEQLIDKLGGVRVYVDRDMFYIDRWGGLSINLQKGWHWLNGKQLQGFLRFRRENTGDIRRIERQQEFLAAFSTGSFSARSLFRIPRALLSIHQITQTNMKLREMIAWAGLLRMFPANQFSRRVVPGSSGSAENGASVWYLNHQELNQILAADFGVAPSFR